MFSFGFSFPNLPWSTSYGKPSVDWWKARPVTFLAITLVHIFTTWKSASGAIVETFWYNNVRNKGLKQASSAFCNCFRWADVYPITSTLLSSLRGLTCVWTSFKRCSIYCVSTHLSKLFALFRWDTSTLKIFFFTTCTTLKDHRL